jgi:hypothetical protein
MICVLCAVQNGTELWGYVVLWQHVLRVICVLCAVQNGTELWGYVVLWQHVLRVICVLCAVQNGTELGWTTNFRFQNARYSNENYIIVFRPLPRSDIKINYTLWICLYTTVIQAFKTCILFKSTWPVHTKKCSSASPKQILRNFSRFPAHEMKLAKPEFVFVVATKNCDTGKWRRATWQEFKMSESNACRQ